MKRKAPADHQWTAAIYGICSFGKTAASPLIHNHSDFPPCKLTLIGQFPFWFKFDQAIETCGFPDLLYVSPP